MKAIHDINTWAVFCNVFLFIVPTVGMLAMILLGVIQVFLALMISIKHRKDLNKSMSVLLYRYWLFVVIDFILIGLARYFTYSPFDLPGVLFYFIFPGLIAFYFMYVTNEINSNNYPS